MKKEEKEEIKKEEAVNEASEKETDNTGNTATPEGNDCENNDADTQTESGNEGGNAGENTAKDPLAEAKDEIEQLKDKYLRSVAEFDNYRKRTLKEKAELILNGSEKAVQAILPVIDDMERAIANAEKTEDVDVLREGMKLIYQKTNKIMESRGRGGFGGFGGSGFGGGGQRRPAQHRGADLRLKVKLSLQEISTGVTKKFKVKKDVTCSHCHGSGAEGNSAKETCPTCHGRGVVTHTTQSMFGMMQTQSVCPTCGGEGTVIKNKCKACGGSGVVKGEEVVEINIPAGVSEGMIVNVPGKGNAGRHNGVPGNIQVYIEEEPNDTFIRDDNDIIYNLLLDFPTAALGGTVEIPTIDGGRVRIKIEPGTQPGKALRLRGKGLPAVQGYGRGVGDMVVNISVYVPKTLNGNERAALEEMRDSANFKGDNATKQTIFQKFKNYFN